MKFYSTWLICVVGVGVICAMLRLGLPYSFIGGGIISLVFIGVDEYRRAKRHREIVAIVLAYEAMYDHQMNQEEANSFKNSEFTPFEPNQCRILPRKMTIKSGYCACGRPLHYNSADVQATVEKLIQECGEFTDVVVEGKTYCVQRHFIALHGLTAYELPILAAAGTVELKNG